LAGVHLWQGRSSPPVVFTRPWHVWTAALVGSAAVKRLGLGERALRTWRHAGTFTPDQEAVYMGPLRRPQSVRATVNFDRSLATYEIPRGIRDFKSWHLSVPTLHLLGAEDRLTPVVPDSYKAYAKDMRVERITGCGHFIPEEAPEALLERLDSFL
jgi:pimeloyl-ACP methyl ester carboxylesterase